MGNKKIYYYKFLIKLDRNLKDFEIKSIKKAIWNDIGNISIKDIHGGQANNNGYYKFKVKS